MRVESSSGIWKNLTPVMEVSICLFMKMNPSFQLRNSCGKLGLTKVARVSRTWSFSRPWVGRPPVHAPRTCRRHAHRSHLRRVNLGLRGKTTNTVAFIVQSGRTLSSTVLNNLASTWDSTIYPTMTTYYGRTTRTDGLHPRHRQQLPGQIVIYDIDGAYNTGGYFAPPFPLPEKRCSSIMLTSPSPGAAPSSPTSEHSYNALDPYENLWIDEGNADVAIYLCFGADSTLTGHVNAWTGAPNNRCDGGISALRTTAPATCSPCTSLSTSAVVPPFANSCRTRQRAAEVLRTCSLATKRAGRPSR